MGLTVLLYFIVGYKINKRTKEDGEMKKCKVLAVGILGVLLTGCSKEPLNLDLGAEYKKLGSTKVNSSFGINRYEKNKEYNSILSSNIHRQIEDSINKMIDVTIGDEEIALYLKDLAVIDGVMYKSGDKTYKYDGKLELVHWASDGIEPVHDINVSKHYEYESELQNLLDKAGALEKKAVRPKYTFNRPNLTVTESGQTGLSVGTEKFKNDIVELINKNTSGDVVLSTSVTYPDVSKEQIQTIDKKLATFSTGFNPGGSRGTNIRVATQHLDGTLVAPGETISVDRLIKSRNAKNGYLPAGSYLNGKTVQTYGGGVCQVSTTLYGAVIRAGIIPVERNAHSMAVSYVPLGLDAAISEGYKDLKIKNTYDLPIYIEGVVNGGTLTFSIYGNEHLLDGYTYKPISTSNKNGLNADSWLQKIKDGQVVEKIHLFKSSYRPHG